MSDNVKTRNTKERKEDTAGEKGKVPFQPLTQGRGMSDSSNLSIPRAPFRAILE